MATTAYGSLAERVLAELEAEACRDFGVARCRAVPRLVWLTVGESSVAVVVRAAHRAPAYEASQFVIDVLDERALTWKQDHLADGATAIRMAHRWRRLTPAVSGCIPQRAANVCATGIENGEAMMAANTDAAPAPVDTLGRQLRGLLREGGDDATIEERLRGIWPRRSDRYSEQRDEYTLPMPKVEMSYIGG
mgnify:CR=1 FL=1